ncbi:MAG: MFS transporter [Thermodesulfobacteriota bacterium]|nr:MFS transporter [Thermodesulfobacteriota bacterium]
MKRPGIPTKALIILADLLSDLGNQFVGFTLLDLLFFKGEKGLSNLLAMCLIEQAPSVCLSPLAGLWIDRVGAKTWLFLVSGGKCLLVGALVFVSSRYLVFTVYLLLIIGSLFFYIGRLSLVPVLIPKDELIPFNAVNERVSLAGRILGPLLISCIVLETGPAMSLGFGGLLFTLSAFLVWRLPDTVSGTERSVYGPFRRHGLRPLVVDFMEPFRGNPKLKACFATFGFVLAGGGMLYLGVPVLCKTQLGKDIADWGLLLSAFQAGACVSTFLLPRYGSAVRRRTLLSFNFLLLAGAIATLSQLRTLVQIALLMSLLGCGFTFMHVFLESLIQKYSPKACIGKTISVLSTYRGLCYLGSIFGSAMVLRIWSPQSLFFTASALMVSAGVITTRKYY